MTSGVSVAMSTIKLYILLSSKYHRLSNYSDIHSLTVRLGFSPWSFRFNLEDQLLATSEGHSNITVANVEDIFLRKLKYLRTLETIVPSLDNSGVIGGQNGHFCVPWKTL